MKTRRVYFLLSEREGTALERIACIQMRSIGNLARSWIVAQLGMIEDQDFEHHDYMRQWDDEHPHLGRR